MTLIDTSITWIPSDDTFGARLAMVRQRFGWNMKEAALACGLPQNSWLDWETRGRTPRNLADVAQKIRERTGADDYWLMTGRRNGEHPSDPIIAESPLSDSNRRPSLYIVDDAWPAEAEKQKAA